MPVALIAATGGTVNAGTTLTLSLDVGTGPNRAVTVTVDEFASVDMSAGTVTVGGVSMGSPIVQSPNVNNNRGFGWVLPTSLTGVQSVVITAPSTAYFDAFASSWSTVDQTTPSDAQASYSNTFTGSPQTLAISVSAGGVAVDMMSRRLSGSSTTPDASQTRLHSEISSGGIAVSGASYKAGATQMQWTHGGASPIAHIIIALKAATGGGGTPPGVAAETDTALALAGTQIRALGMASETDTALALVALAGLPFNTAPYEFGQRTGLDVADFSIYASTAINVSVYAAADVLLASQLFSYTETTGADGRLTRKTHASLTAGSTYIFVAVTAGGAMVAAGRITAT